jgi:hypothetical protein
MAVISMFYGLIISMFYGDNIIYHIYTQNIKEMRQYFLSLTEN